jgi:hypothetical protein
MLVWLKNIGDLSKENAAVMIIKISDDYIEQPTVCYSLAFFRAQRILKDLHDLILTGRGDGMRANLLRRQGLDNWRFLSKTEQSALVEESFQMYQVSDILSRIAQSLFLQDSNTLDSVSSIGVEEVEIDVSWTEAADFVY